MTIGETQICDHSPSEVKTFTRTYSTSIDLEPGRTFAIVEIKLLAPNHPESEKMVTKFNNLIKLLVK